MRVAGIYLIYTAVVVRGLVRLGEMQHPGTVVALLVLYGLLLAIETGMGTSWPWRLGDSANPGTGVGAAGRVLRKPALLLAYLLVQSGLVIGLLLSRPVQDSFSLLFVPLSLQAVLFLGRQLGFLCIAAFTLAMTGPLLASQEGWRFGLVMVVNYGGLCFLIGGYAHQVRAAETARCQSQSMLRQLQAAHHQLQGYAAQLDELAAEQERSRLARDLHDSVTQTVFSMNLTVQSARLLLDRDRARVAGQLDRLEELAAGAMREIQSLVSQLRSSLASPLGVEGLPAALRQLAVERRERDGLDVALEVSGEGGLPESVAAGLYGIAQEALANVAKHAGTPRAALRLGLVEGASFLEVEDAGLGFDPQAAWGRQGHLGLAGMADRARELGWMLSVESRPGCGTRVRVEEPTPGDQG